jgi:HK97 family phage prohead protease
MLKHKSTVIASNVRIGFGRKREGGQLHHKEFSFKADAINEDGTFTGYASVFGTVDSYNEVVAPGAFVDSLKEIAASGDPLPALWQHRSGTPIGGYKTLKEDAKGLFAEGWLLKDDVVQAREAFALMKARVVKGMSIGYYVLESSYNEKTGIRTLTKLELVEISIVTFPANPDAQIDAIKSKLAQGALPTLREFEQILREQGFSKTQAAVIANRGLKHLLDRGEPESDGETEEKASIAAMNKLLDGPLLPQL